MKRSYWLPSLVILAPLASGACTAVIYRSSKLYFYGDGGGTDSLIIFKMMLLCLVCILPVIGAYAAIKSGAKRALMAVSKYFALGLVTVIVFGMVLTQLSYHSACDEYGSTSGVCALEPVPDFF